MKRFVIFFALLLMTCLTVSAAYKIELKDGTYINADAKPVVKDDFAYFFKSGMYLYIASARIDFQKTTKVNEEVAKEQPDTKPAPKVEQNLKPVFINDEDLQLIRKRSHLANESSTPTFGSGKIEASSGAPLPDQEQTGMKDVDAMRSNLTDLLSQRAEYQQRRDLLRSRLADLKNRFNFSAMQNEKERLQGEIDDAQSQMTQVEEQLASMDASIKSLQQQIAATPIVVNTQRN